MANTEKFLNSSGLSSLWAKIKSRFYTKTEVDALIPESEIFIVNITYDSENDKNTADKSKIEVDSALNAGKIIMGLYDGEYYEYDGFYFYHNNPFSGHPYSSVYNYIENSNINELEFHSFSFVSQDDLTAFQSNYLSIFNTTSYTPTGDYNPATKKYVDDVIKSASDIIYGQVSISGTSATFSSITPKIINDAYINHKSIIVYEITKSPDQLNWINIYKLSDVNYGLSNRIQAIFTRIEDDTVYSITTLLADRTSSTACSGTVSTIRIPSASTSSPLMDGEATIGDSINYARANHVHPSDTSRAAVADVLTKTNTTSYTPTADYNPATKKYVDDSISAATPSCATIAEIEEMCGVLGFRSVTIDTSDYQINT